MTQRIGNVADQAERADTPPAVEMRGIEKGFSGTPDISVFGDDGKIFDVAQLHSPPWLLTFIQRVLKAG